ncbi:MAG: MerC domain-containing protein [Idiomarina sp.]
MVNLQKISDKTAIGLSALCLIHCLLLPILLITLPPITGLLILDDETFHQWMLFAVVPVSLIALLIGHRHHRSYRTLLVGFIGLATLAFTAFIDHHTFSPYADVIFTVIGSSIITYAHIRNYQLRSRQQSAAKHAKIS